MKPFKWDKKYLYWGITAFLVIISSIVFFLGLSRLSVIWAALRRIVAALSPILYGLVFAYLLNKLMSLFEASFLDRAGRRLSPDNPARAKSISRAFGVILTFIVLLVIVGGTLALIIPQIYVSVQSLVHRLPSYYTSVVGWSSAFLSDNPNLESSVAEFFGNITNSLTSWLQTTLLSRTDQIITNVTTGVFNFLKELASIVIGFIVSIYLLHHKERFSAQCKRLLYGFFKPRRANSILKSARFLDKTVGGFFLGKIIESIIVGMISYIFLVIFRMPYAVLIAVLLTVTNLIPFFGVFIGAVPSALMILLEDPLKCLIFVIYIIVLHMFASNILAPRVQGETIGLGGFWVLFAILLFGGLFGFWGLLLGVPVFAVIYAAISGYNRNQLRKKNYPVSTAAYENILCIDPETGAPVCRADGETGKKAKGNTAKKHDQDHQDDAPKDH
ncbi:Predicted PurR-regulated permease PerM [Sporobacter termitidis DSM 10068]|uniref:Predicted PurR-regulated permease PerM n=1 Tax=Sporobacter termitidis DSM 10068 TaxID=1123282 RepID=A0A1M5VNI2_9FIRM|nr:AI-2E family transporter [Sporobacter termitidis]SHH76785.1 Predicted PurR-regulated permease PerM [Sporobacter termitidis DSM 10068]